MINKLVLGNLNENCYIISNNQNNCIIIDAGDGYDEIINFIESKNLNVLGVLLTHGHFDHCSACKKLQDKGFKIYIHKLDADKLYGEGNLSSLTNASFEKFKADVEIEEGELNIGEFKFNVIHTPGHSEGSVSYIYNNNVFCGDTLFENGFGRYDFYDGSYMKIVRSIKKLKSYKNLGYNFFYGH